MPTTKRAPPKTATPGAAAQPTMPREKTIDPRNSRLREPSRLTSAAAAAAPSIMPTATSAPAVPAVPGVMLMLLSASNEGTVVP